MKAILGAVVLLLVLALVGSLVVRQLESMSASHATSAPATANGTQPMPNSPRAAEDQVRRDIDRAMQAASAARTVD